MSEEKQTQEIARSQQDSPGDAVLTVIARAASDPTVDVEKMRSLLDLQERIMDRQAETAFNASMQAAQSELKQIVRDAKATPP